VDEIRDYVQNGVVFYAKEVVDGKWLTTGDPLNYLKAVLAYAVDRDDIRAPLLAYMQSLTADQQARS
jgi:hypothetical protein